MPRPRLPALPLQLQIVLIVGLSVAAALLASGALLLELDERRSRRDLLREYDLIAHIAAQDLVGALAFDDAVATSNSLEALRRHPELAFAAVVDGSGALLESSGDGQAWPVPADDQPDHGHFEAGRVRVAEPVLLGSELLGWLQLEWDAERIATQRDLATRNLLLALLAGALVAIPVSFPVQRRLTAPLRGLTANAERLRRGDHELLPVEEGRGDEIGRLARAFNLMLEELQRREQGMQDAARRAELLAEDAFEKAATIELTNAQLRAEIREREALQGQLLRSQRMELLGQMAGGVAHDFNNLLTVIFGWAAQAEKNAERPEEVREALQRVVGAAQQAAGVTAQLLAYARKRPLDRQPESLPGIITRVEKLMGRILPEQIDLRIDLPGEDIEAFVDRGQVEQVLVNLVVNARDAMGGQGRLVISAGRGTPDLRKAEGFALRSGTEYAWFTVEDDGPGIPDGVLEKIFEPYFTTKPVGEGSGLGLSVCYGIVQEHQGAITVDTRAGEGTRFTVYLPLASRDIMPAASEPPAAAPPPVDATALVVEDEPEVRRLVAETLRSAGYTVLESRNGDDALRLLEERPEPVQLVVSDLRMPGLSGREFVARARASRPGLPAVLVSGHFDDAAGIEALEATGPTRRLQKPFHPDELLRVAARLLGVLP